MFIRAVIDTNVLFEGLTKQGGSSGLVIDLWLAGVFQPCVSDTLVYEYLDVFQRKLSQTRWQEIEPVLEKLLHKVEFVIPYYSWRPASPDPGDDHLINCAMNGRAMVVTLNRRDFRLAEQQLKLTVLSPLEFIALLTTKPSKGNGHHPHLIRW